MTKRWLRGALLAAVALVAMAPPAHGRDLYRKFLDPAIPHHRAILDTLQRLEETPNDARLHNDLGALVARDGFWRDALREFETAAKLDKKDGRPHFNAGLVHAYKGEWRSARSAFGKSTRRDPGNWPAWWMLGYTQEKLFQYEAAIESYARSLRVDSSLYDVARNPFAADTVLKGRVLLETHDQRLLKASLRKTQQIADPERIGAFFQKAAPPPEPVAEVAPQPVPVVEEPSASGPVVSSVTGAGPGGASQPSPPGAGSRRGLRSVPPRGFPSRPAGEQSTQPPQPPRRMPVGDQPQPEPTPPPDEE